MASLLDVLKAAADKHRITKDEFTEAMRSGDPAKKEEAVEAMLDAGGYDNLEEL